MKTVDLFAGCGGMSLGFQNKGFEIVAAFENWEKAIECYKTNFVHPVYNIDLSDYLRAVQIIEDLEPSVIIGGPPCQDFSHAGKRMESDRANLTKSFAKIINHIRPKMFVMENVDRSRKSLVYAEARQLFKDAGYGLTELVLDASLCGVPQKRKRFFCIGSLSLDDDFATEYIVGRLSSEPMTLRDYFGNSLDFEYYYRHPRNYSRRGVFSIDEPAPTMRGVNRPVPDGYPGHKNDACDINDSVRALTTLERSMIQTFPSPPDYAWVGNKTDMEQMIGNAVPVKLAEFVADTVSHFLTLANKIEHIDSSGFIEWLEETHGYAQRTAKDTVSRVRRANRILPAETLSSQSYFDQLIKAGEYQKLSSSTRSHIRKSVELFIEYQNASDQKLVS